MVEEKNKVYFPGGMPHVQDCKPKCLISPQFDGWEGDINSSYVEAVESKLRYPLLFFGLSLLIAMNVTAAESEYQVNV